MKLMLIYEDVVADTFGKELKRVLSQNEAFAIIDSDPSSTGGTFTQGGCYVLASALNSLIPTSEIWGVYRDGGKGIMPKGYGDHFVLRVGNVFYDADGASDANKLLRRWKNSELVREPALQKARPVDVHPETPKGKGLITKIKQYLLSDDAFKQALFNLSK